MSAVGASPSGATETSQSSSLLFDAVEGWTAVPGECHLSKAPLPLPDSPLCHKRGPCSNWSASSEVWLQPRTWKQKLEPHLPPDVPRALRAVTTAQNNDNMRQILSLL